jgi:hypothetical protein
MLPSPHFVKTVAPRSLSIVVSGDSRALIDGYFETRSLGAVEVKGILEPLSCVHGVGRWYQDCGAKPADPTGGTRPGGGR